MKMTSVKPEGVTIQNLDLTSKKKVMWRFAKESLENREVGGKAQFWRWYSLPIFTWVRPISAILRDISPSRRMVTVSGKYITIRLGIWTKSGVWTKGQRTEICLEKMPRFFRWFCWFEGDMMRRWHAEPGAACHQQRLYGQVPLYPGHLPGWAQ